jgi:hypothetical protein
VREPDAGRQALTSHPRPAGVVYGVLTSFKEAPMHEIRETPVEHLRHVVQYLTEARRRALAALRELEREQEEADNGEH